MSLDVQRKSNLDNVYTGILKFKSGYEGLSMRVDQLNRNAYESHKDFEKLRAEMSTQLGRLSSEMTAEFWKSRTEITSELWKLRKETLVELWKLRSEVHSAINDNNHALHSGLANIEMKIVKRKVAFCRQACLIVNNPLCIYVSYLLINNVKKALGGAVFVWSSAMMGLFK
ncbi:hypothetical protein VTN77DRAFT_3917 [Rasamsonia byssochlamydoides]|uniref:uncharacterized protein n=1 Tax=Rasamsonia byssochlamydoides TaxID=89139 RepID=UPI003743DF2F